jgi:hypothetical protein
MNYFSEDSQYVNAECEKCGRVLKIPREKCSAISQGEFSVSPAIMCQCRVVSDHISKAKKKNEPESNRGQSIFASPTSNRILQSEQRREILQQEINKYLKRGYRVISQTDTTAQLIKPKRFSFLWAVAWFFVFGFGLLIYVFWYLSRKDETIYLEVSSNGQVFLKK